METLFITTALSEYLQKNGLEFLLEIIRSMQDVYIVSEEKFQVWKFRRVVNENFVLELQDGNKTIILNLFYTSQYINIDSLEMWFENSTLFFPTER